MDKLDKYLADIVTAHKEGAARSGSYPLYAQLAQESPRKFEELMERLAEHFSRKGEWEKEKKTFATYRSLFRRAIRLRVPIITADGILMGKTALERACQEKENR